MVQLKDGGFDAVYCSLNEGNKRAEQLVRSQLKVRRFDCAVIGAGLRLLPKHTIWFEALVNTVIEVTPTAKLAFNATPAAAADAVRRQFP